MGYRIAKLQNVSESSKDTPTIVINVGDFNWSTAYSNWLEGKVPTSDPEWKQGVFACFREVYDAE